MSDATATMAPPEHDNPLVKQFDEAVLARDASAVPPEHRAACEAVLQAWTAYENGDDETARAALQTLNVTSPFNEWKLLLRGLLAYAARDSARALENFHRLKPGRVPARLAQPVRAELDPAFQATLPQPLAELFRSLFTSKRAESVKKLLHKLQLELGRDKPFSQALTTAIKLLPELRQMAPSAVPMLTEVIYAQMDLKGSPTDLRYCRGAFRLPSDPEYHVLEARKLEGFAPDRAAKHIEKHIAWLKPNPLGWAAELHRCILANFWLDLAELNPAQRPKALKEAVRVDPDSEVVMLAYLRDAARTIGPGQFSAIAQEYLQRHPEAKTVCEQVLQYLEQIPGGSEYYLDFAKLLLAQNPFAETARRWYHEGLAYHFAKPFALPDWHAVERLIEDESALSIRCRVSVLPAAALVLQLRLQPAKAITERLATTNLDFYGRVTAWCFTHLGSYKQAQRKPFELWLRESLAAGPDVDVLIQASRFLSVIETSLRKITGIKKLQAEIRQSVSVRLSSLSLAEPLEEAVVKILNMGDKKAALKMLQGFEAKFPRNPILIVSLATLRLGQGKLSRQKLARLRTSLNHAMSVAQTHSEPRYQKLIPQIQHLMEVVSLPENFRDLLDL